LFMVGSLRFRHLNRILEAVEKSLGKAAQAGTKKNLPRLARAFAPAGESRGREQRRGLAGVLLHVEAPGDLAGLGVEATNLSFGGCPDQVAAALAQDGRGDHGTAQLPFPHFLAVARIDAVNMAVAGGEENARAVRADPDVNAIPSVGLPLAFSRGRVQAE